MQKHPVDVEILRGLATAIPLPGQCYTALFWFSVYFNDSYTLMLERAEDARDKSCGFFLTSNNAGGSYDSPIQSKGGTDMGEFHVNNGGVIAIQWLNVSMPIREWEEAYIAEYNRKYNKQFLTMSQAYKLLMAADQLKG